jgi:hypothetical protein
MLSTVKESIQGKTTCSQKYFFTIFPHYLCQIRMSNQQFKTFKEQKKHA